MTQIAHAGFPASTGMFLGLAGFVATIMTVSVYGVCFCSYALSRVLVGWNLVWEIDFSDFHNRAVPDLEDAGGHRADRRPRGASIRRVVGRTGFRRLTRTSRSSRSFRGRSHRRQRRASLENRPRQNFSKPRWPPPRRRPGNRANMCRRIRFAAASPWSLKCQFLPVQRSRVCGSTIVM